MVKNGVISTDGHGSGERHDASSASKTLGGLSTTGGSERTKQVVFCTLGGSVIFFSLLAADKLPYSWWQGEEPSASLFWSELQSKSRAVPFLIFHSTSASDAV